MDIYVYIDAIGITEGPQFMGVLRAESIRGKEVFSFRYDKAMLRNKAIAYLDPDIQPYEGEQYAPAEKENFGIFLDSCPDRWGRVLMQRRERIRAKDAGTEPRKLRPSDYLLGVFDGNRMGALRFKTSLDGSFLDNDEHLAAPPITTLRTLEQASLNYERDDAEDSPEYRLWLRMLYQPGSSLGGARPKANVIDTDGSLWIAKFPSRHDDIDVGAWEFIVTQMAGEFGIHVPQTAVRRYSSRHHTFLTRRFDRDGMLARYYFASAMTLLGYTDGDDAAAGVSYLELADFIQQYGTPKQQQDLHELWRRVVFNIAISNCDDHLRNHGFMLSAKGWQLSPAYDLTPNPDGLGLKLNINENDNSLDFDLAIQTAPLYGMGLDEAEHAVETCRKICSSWRGRADALGISRSEQDRMASAFKTISF